MPSGKKGMEGEMGGAANIMMGVEVTTLDLKDMEDIEKLSNIKEGYAGIMGQEQVSYGNEVRKAFLFGTSPSYIDIDKSAMEYGRFFTEAEDKSLAQVAVLGSVMKEKLFGDSDAIGQSIKIRKSKYRIIGIMEERGAMMTMDFDDFVYIPVQTLQKRIMGINHVLYMVHQVRNLDIAEETAEEMRMILRKNHNISDPVKDDFRVVTMAEMLDMMSIITDTITLLLLAIVAISLIVGGVGIMNVMYVIVGERTQEVGLRKAVGASSADIMKQFLIESILITTLGGVAGVIIGATISFLISVGANFYGLDWHFALPLKSFIIALSFSFFFGIVFGIYPARKAAALHPIEALQYE